MQTSLSTTFWSRRIRAVAVLALACPSIAAGDIQFVEGAQRITDMISTGVALVDVDGDDDLDAIVSTYVGPILVFFNDGSGTFTDSGQRLEAVLAGEPQVADFDGDGDADFFIHSHSLPSALYLNDGLGVFTDSGQEFGSAQTTAVDAGDLDGDGDVDLFIGDVFLANRQRRNVVMFNDGSGSMSFTGDEIPLPPRGLALGDLDGDGDLDAFLARGHLNRNDLNDNRVLLNDGNGRFAPTAQSLGRSFSKDVALADLDGDGDLDAFVVNEAVGESEPGHVVWCNNGDGSFTESGPRLGSSRGNDVDLADFDRDGDIDALVTNFVGPGEIWVNDGNAGFSLGATIDLGDDSSNRSALGDLDGDGDIDIYLASGGDGDRVFFNATPVGRQAELIQLRVIQGTRISGDLRDLVESDDQFVLMQARVTGEVAQPHLLRVRLTADSEVQSAEHMSITVEGRITDMSAQTTLLLRDWVNGGFVRVARFSMGMDETVHLSEVPEAADFVRASDGRIRVELEQIVFFPFTLGGFHTLLDHVEVRVR